MNTTTTPKYTKSPYVIFFRYDQGEDYEIYHIGNNLKVGKQVFNKEFVDFFGYGPDDCSQLWFCKLKDITPEMFDILVKNMNNESLTDPEKTILSQEIFSDSWGWDRSKHFQEDIYVCYGDDIGDIMDSLGYDTYDEDFDWSNLSNDEFSQLLSTCVPF